MAVDTPAHVVIVGLNPLALEAGLYARFLGYQVSIFDSGTVCEAIRNRPDQLIEGQSITSLGSKAIAAQGDSFDAQSITESISTNRDWWEKYVKPLSETDLLIDSLFAHHAVASIELIDEQLEGDEQSEGDELDRDEVCTTVFKIIVSGNDASVKTEPITADVVIDVQLDGFVNFDVLPSLGIDASELLNDDSSLFTSVDDFYVLGDRKIRANYGHADGLSQIRDLFKIIGDRESLDLYS
jgi:hypothetical protein